MSRLGGLATTSLGRRLTYVVAFLVLLVVYAVVTSVMWSQRTWSDQGPLSYHRPAASVVLHPTREVGSLDEIKRSCVSTGDVHDPEHIKVVGATVEGTDYYACYQLKDGKVYDATVIDVDGVKAPVGVVQEGGAWRWIGLVKTPTDLVLGGVGIAALGGLFYLYYRRDRPAAPRDARWWQTWWAQVLFTALCLVQPVSLLFRRGESGARRVRLFLEWLIATSLFFLFAIMLDGRRDALSTVVLGLLAVAALLGWGLGRLLLALPGFGRTPDGELQQAPVAVPVAARSGTAASAAAPVGPLAAPVTAARAATSPWASRVRRPGVLPSFRDVGGMESLKRELDDSLGLLLAFDAEADRYRISFNGILLHGDPGVGKSFLAQATAGEYGLNLLAVSSSDLISKYVGESAQNVAELFREAARNVPCLLFFDEFDSLAERRDEGLSEESTRVVNQLLQSLEEWRGTRELIVMAATNHLDRLDPAVVRPGRFDRRIRVDLPDQPARVAILTAQLADRPLADDVDLEDVAHRLAGRTPAVIARVANAAALTAFQQATQGAGDVRITHRMLRDALENLGGKDRPTVEDWSWDRIVLGGDTKAELQQVQAIVKDPDLAASYGVTPPSGLLLAGPPGTGKTTIARVFAAQSGCSFYPQTAADLTSKWVGESEASVSRLFARARDNAPSIIFIDEIDAIASARSDAGSSYLDRTLTQLLTELDGLTEQRGVFVLAATNRPDTLDPALLRGGRLSRTIWVPLPDEAQRRQLLGIFTADMPLHAVDLDALARETDGFSGADIEALCQQAALTAMTGAQGGAPAVDAAAFAKALAAKRVGHAAPVPADTPAPEPPSPGGYL